MTPAEERHPQAWVQRVLLCTKGRAVSLHTTHEITSQVGARAGFREARGRDGPPRAGQ